MCFILGRSDDPDLVQVAPLLARADEVGTRDHLAAISLSAGDGHAMETEEFIAPSSA